MNSRDKKCPLGKWLPQAGKGKEFFERQNQQMPIRISYKVPMIFIVTIELNLTSCAQCKISERIEI